MIKKNPQLNQNNVNKSVPARPGERSIFSINRINENQQVVLMIINKPILLRNENDNRFHSHHSKVILKTRTQSATITKSLVSLVLYIYKKWKCVESLTIPGGWLTSANSVGMIGTSITHEPIEHQSNLVNRGDGEIYTDTHSEV